MSLKDKTWIHRGGNVKYWWLPKKREGLIEIGKFLYKNNYSFITIGHTSNIYFKNSFNIDHIIDTRRLTTYHINDDDSIACDCGAHLAKISMCAIEKGFKGYEGLINLPGTVGGAVVNNSGCYNCGIDKILKSVDLLTPAGCVLNYTVDKLDFSFRSSALKRGKLKGIITEVYLDTSQKADSNELKRMALINTENRRLYQDPPSSNLGSTVNLGRLYPSSIIRNILIRFLSKVYNSIQKDFLKQNKFAKEVILLFYRKRYLSKYISDKRNSCFLWKDNDADHYFDDYLELLNRLYSQVSIEIEVYK